MGGKEKEIQLPQRGANALAVSHAAILSRILRENFYRETIYASTNYARDNVYDKLTLITINLER